MKYRVHELVKFRYSDIGEYIDENHTDRPLRNDILVDLLNRQEERIKELKEENASMKGRIINAMNEYIASLQEVVDLLNDDREWNDDL